MAWVSQEDKAKIAAELKKVVPSGWKYSLSVRDKMTICMTIKSAPLDLIRAFKASEYFNPETATDIEVSNYYCRSQIADECVADVFESILRALNTDNYDRSDTQRDYFDVGHYVNLRIGRWDKPFVVTGDMAKHKENATT